MLRIPIGIKVNCVAVSFHVLTSCGQKLNVLGRITQPIDLLRIGQGGDIRVDAREWRANAGSVYMLGGEGEAGMKPCIPMLPQISEMQECRPGVAMHHVGLSTCVMLLVFVSMNVFCGGIAGRIAACRILFTVCFRAGNLCCLGGFT